MLFKNKVNIVDRPGYFGKKRLEIEKEYNKQFGSNWFECWETNNLILEFNEAVLLYDTSYLLYISNLVRSELNQILCHGECYDSNKNNIHSGLFHDEYEAPRHIQDVSIRRALIKMGMYFNKYKGSNPDLYTEDELLHVRGPGTNGEWLNPNNVPFHHPRLINFEVTVKNIPSWLNNEYSVESFWQRNKVIICLKN